MFKRMSFRAVANSRAGFSLVELTVSTTMLLVLGVMIFTFVMFASKSLRKVLAMQMLQQEATVIAEVFRNKVRNASFITVGYDEPATPPSKDTSGVYAIRLFDKGGTTPMGSFDISDNILYIDYYLAGENKDRVLTRNLWAAGDPPTNFKVFKLGNHVEFHLNLFRTMGDDTLFVAQVVGDVRCKNWVNF